MERDGGDNETNDHTRGGENHNLAAADDIYVLQRKEREDKVRARYNQANGNGVVKADLLEEGGYRILSGLLLC